MSTQDNLSAEKKLQVALVNVAIAQIRLSLPNMNDAKRLELFDLIQEGYCRWCGNNQPCFCARDE